jgi:branched-chain amino acid transport system ATP-binding protein
MTSALLEVRALSKRFGGFSALSDVTLSVRTGERLGIIGPNGSGKTTLINCIAGALRSDNGSIEFKGANVTRLATHRRTRLGIARSFQVPRPFASMTLAENVAIPLEYVAHRGSLHAANVRSEAETLLQRMGLGGKAQVPASSLTQVDLRKLELARAMATRPSLLILDEAMAGLSSGEVDEVLELLFDVSGQGVTIIMIEHIMRAIMRFSERVVCLDAGCIIAEGTPAQIAADANVQRIYLGA